MTIEDIYQLYSTHYKVDTDTRSIRKNTIFFALKGENFNGNKFAKEALNNGAIYAIVDEKEYQTEDRIILVDNVLECLQQLANYHRKKLKTPILSLTGSNGKTTTKELINVVLSKKFKTTATKGNLNNHIGVPLTLLSMKPDTEFGIVEMGANHLKEIDFLCQITEPNYGYITNFGKAHLEGFGGIEGVIKGKSELYDYLKKSNGKIFLNDSDETQVKQSENIHSIPFDSSLEYIDANPFVKLNFNNIELKTKLIGSYNYNNIAAAITIGTYFGIDKLAIKEAIENYIPTNNRSQIIKKETTRIILDAYNANPSSMTLALQNFDNLDTNDKIIILGDMFELGETAAQEHQNIVNIVEDMNVKSVFLIGELFSKTTTKKASKFERFDDFISNFNKSYFENCSILIKGSRGMALERVLSYF
ncbi:UDP-N-acetylmuramoyl-tripeptide--D-alanyl-D-alanine ligase [Urechidicola croceus]|uniref:UDP-N-acetylmuramoyl-tripeptide--D-alanyl-D-alanine ligase n=1 Tax=Urechidicola croceus TaxID=1850246 RepID=A0A1D8P6W0_9FLAO|nr:UDP-N-acetylmuramoyl-tripeptide--D-alanyl-D-alanine ligase [Urechidicola croceus]AOW20313.1 UDP-N-acetylmuramoyl-tripeptide--D-alanyl-D-alanine ligase [Urechidicola croceus]